MKGQLFQIRNTSYDDIALLWCSDEFIAIEAIQPIIDMWYANIDNTEVDDLIYDLEVYLQEVGAKFERVYFEEIIIK